MADESPARVTRVVLKNYKSIVHCDVELKPLTILVGPNGSGKSNFVDALRFVQEALTVGLEQAIRNRGNMSRILSEGRPTGSSSFSIGVDFRLQSSGSGHYFLEIETNAEAGYRVRSEILRHRGLEELTARDLYSIDQDAAMIQDSKGATHKYSTLSRDQLYLFAYSVIQPARRVYELLESMAFYDPNPPSMRIVRPHESGIRLLPDSSNVASIVRRAAVSDPEFVEHIGAYLARILPGLREIRAEELGGYDLLSLRQDIANESGWWDARPDQISEGTLRALGILVALFQGRLGGKSETSLVGVEEPEAGVHPAAARVLLGAMQDASYTTQVLATTHSADMLTMGEVDLDSLLVVSADDGVTRIGPIDDVSRSVVVDHLYTVGELLQADQIQPKVVTHDDKGAGDPAPAIGRT